MANFRRWFFAAALIALSTGLASAQVGVKSQGGGGFLSCMAMGAGVPELRPEGYTELVGDIMIECTGGMAGYMGTQVPTTTIVVYLSPSVPITSRFFDSNGASEAMLIIDEAGSSVATGAQGGYGPQAPQSLCTTAQQQQLGGSPCTAYVGVDTSGQYQVAVQSDGKTPAQNVYQGKIGDYGVNSVAFYGVPVLAPADQGVMRTYRITNIRVPVPGGNLTGALDAFISTSGAEALPVSGSPVMVGIVGPPMKANVDAAPAGGGNTFVGCVPTRGPTLAAQVTFTEGFAQGFKTRVVPLTDAAWASTVPNTATPGQNIPGGMYGGFAANSESGFILPAASITPISGVTYTAGLADYGTRLKAVFMNVPVGVSLYVSTTSAASYATPGGTNTAPYAVLVADSQSNEGNSDQATITPLTSAITGSDGLSAYPLTTDISGNGAAIWEVVNANPNAVDTLTFSVYVAYNSSFGTINPTNVGLSIAPEPGGGTFPTANATQGLTTPAPRFAVLSQQGGSWLTINSCLLNASSTPVPFFYSISGTAPASQNVAVTIKPGTLTVTATPVVITPNGENWLSASLSGGTLTISANPTGLSASATAYTGWVKLSATGVSDVLVPATLTVYPPSALSITTSHVGNFVVGQPEATYTLIVSNGASAGPTSGTVTVTEYPPSSETVVSMTSTGSVWTCTTSSCTTNYSIAGGGTYPAITVTVSVASNATSLLTNVATVSGGGSASGPTTTANDQTTIVPLTCTVTGDHTPSVADVRELINEALGVVPPVWDLNSDGSINVGDVQVVISAATGHTCVL